MKQAEVFNNVTYVNGWIPAIYMSLNFRICLLMYPRSVTTGAVSKTVKSRADGLYFVRLLSQKWDYSARLKCFLVRTLGFLLGTILRLFSLGNCSNAVVCDMVCNVQTAMYIVHLCSSVRRALSR